jgi:hypothetical protein
MTIESASAKVRTGPPNDDEQDYTLPIWAGVVPLEVAANQPIDDPRLLAQIDAPQYAKHYVRKAGRKLLSN